MTARPLGFRERFGYGVGDFAFNLFFTTAGLYLLFYYTDVLGLSPAVAGWVFAGALIWDAVFDPFMGYVASRTRSRWGRYRPYLLWGAVPLAAAWALMFVPVGLEGSALMLFAAATHILFRTLYAVVSMPYLALSAVMTSDSRERGVLASFRMAAAATCGLFAAFSTLKLVEAFGGGAEGFFRTALLFGGLATAVLLFVFASTKEAARPIEEEQPSARDMLRMLRSNRAFWIVSAAMLIASIAGTFFQKTIPYYFKYALGREDLIGPALTLLTGAVTLSIPLWTLVMNRTSKRTMWLSGLGVGLCGYALLWAVPPSPSAILPVLILLGIGAGASYIGFWAMMPDTVEYGEWRSGVRAEGAIFGLVSLVQKAGLGLAAAALGELLGAIGYRANVAQRPETLASMKLVMVAAPAVLGLAVASIIAFYPLDRRTHARMVRVAAWRNSRRRAALAVKA
jgi:GPH family glycoside/pentoside/hexuronide:cation symporter